MNEIVKSSVLVLLLNTLDEARTRPTSLSVSELLALGFLAAAFHHDGLVRKFGEAVVARLTDDSEAGR